jgi:hypothetical protein
LEKLESHTLVLEQDLVFQDFLGCFVRIKKFDLGLCIFDIVSLIIIVLLQSVFDSLDGLVDLSNIARGGSSEFGEMISKSLQIVVEVIRLLDHFTETLDLVVELFPGQIFLGQLLLLPFLVIKLLFFEIKNFLGGESLLIVPLLNLGLHEEPLGEVIDWIAGLLLVHVCETLRNHRADVILHDVF